VDPGNTDDSCDPSLEVEARVIIVSSPDKKHWGGSEFSKSRFGRAGGVFRFFPAWELEQLIVASVHVNVSRDDVKKKFETFGGIPRYIFANADATEGNKDDIERKLKALTALQLKQLVTSEFDIFALFESARPQGALVVFKPKSKIKSQPSDDGDVEMAEENDAASQADSETSLFRSADVVLASEFVKYTIFQRFMSMIWTELTIHPSPIAWQLMEEYTIQSLLRESEYLIRQGAKGPRYGKTEAIRLGGCHSQAIEYDCSTAVKDGRDKCLFFSSDRNHPLYDMIYKDKETFHAFQVTISKTHDSKKNQIETVAHKLNIGGKKKLNLYYVVHEQNFDVFVMKPKQPQAPDGVSI
jgi:hypothetical protein